MAKKIKISKGDPFPMGVKVKAGGINVSVAFSHVPKKEGGILFYDRRKKETRIPFPDNCRIGSIYAVYLKMDISAYHSYLFYCDEKTFMDPYAIGVDGRNQWGQMRHKSQLSALLPSETAFDWGSDRFPETPFEDSVIYGLHVRGFTKHVTSGVERQKRGTFEGLEEKIPYLKELGVTAIECMPVYEFDEIIVNPAYEATRKAGLLAAGAGEEFIGVKEQEDEPEARTDEETVCVPDDPSGQHVINENDLAIEVGKLNSDKVDGDGASDPADSDSYDQERGSDETGRAGEEQTDGMSEDDRGSSVKANENIQQTAADSPDGTDDNREDGVTENVHSAANENGRASGKPVPVLAEDTGKTVKKAVKKSASSNVNGYALTDGNWEYKINYWGFADRGSYYFAPKASYSAYHDPVRSFKHLVRALHQAGIEIILQLYFPLRYDPCYIQRVVHYWVMNYHVDGFHLVGMKIPRSLLALDPLLSRTKLIMEEPGGERIYAERGMHPEFRNLASYRDDFRCDARKFLKGDEDMLRPMAEHMRKNDELQAVIHHVADYRGFTLMDLVSFDQKHNGPNGENNRDGSEYNYSWNCGVEGSSRKKGIQAMRLSQRKNILSFLFLSQAVPFLQAGDEFGHTANGNNNPYCQDNEINHLSWRLDQPGKKLLEFTKGLIAFRKAHKITHRRYPLRIMDTISCGYPDLSYHGENAWQAQMENYNRHMGIMLCGLYENLPGGGTDDFVYMAINMHWIAHSFALPSLPGGYEWKMVCDTRSEDKDSVMSGFELSGSPIMKEETEDGKNAPMRITLKPRSVVLLVGRQMDTKDKRKRKNPV